MNRLSLRVRLLIASGMSIVVALTAIGLSLAWVFERHVLRQHEATAVAYINQLISRVQFDDKQTPTLPPERTDPRFNQPLSGYYWQVESRASSEVFRSRSLWDMKLQLPASQVLGQRVARAGGNNIRHYKLSGPDASSLVAWERQALFAVKLADGETEKDIALRFVFALDESLVDQARNDFLIDILPDLAITGLALIIASWFQVKVGLAPLEKIRQGILPAVSGSSIST